MKYELGQIIEEVEKVWKWTQGAGWQRAEVVKQWKIINITYDNDKIISVLGEYEGELKLLYLAQPYVVGCNKPIPLIYHLDNCNCR